MANEISNMTLASMSSPVKETGQFVTSGTVKAGMAAGKGLPQQGNTLPQQAGRQPVSKGDLEQTVSQVNELVQSVKRNLSFSLDEASGHTVIKVVDSDSGKLVRQIPSEEVIALASYLQSVQEDAAVADKMPTGILFSGKS